MPAPPHRATQSLAAPQQPRKPQGHLKTTRSLEAGMGHSQRTGRPRPRPASPRQGTYGCSTRGHSSNAAQVPRAARLSKRELSTVGHCQSPFKGEPAAWGQWGSHTATPSGRRVTGRRPLVSCVLRGAAGQTLPYRANPLTPGRSEHKAHLSADSRAPSPPEDHRRVPVAQGEQGHGGSAKTGANRCDTARPPTPQMCKVPDTNNQAEWLSNKYYCSGGHER